MARFRFGRPDRVTPLHYVCFGLFWAGAAVALAHRTAQGVIAGIVLMVATAATVRISRRRGRR
jgi:uncharacterized membrane protein